MYLDILHQMKLRQHGDAFYIHSKSPKYTENKIMRPRMDKEGYRQRRYYLWREYHDPERNIITR